MRQGLSVNIVSIPGLVYGQSLGLSSIIHKHKVLHCSRLRLSTDTECASPAGSRFGPPGSKQLVYFVDDMNMPYVDKYDTQSAIELMRQSVDYKGWFDKVCLTLMTDIRMYKSEPSDIFWSFRASPRMQLNFVNNLQ